MTLIHIVAFNHVSCEQLIKGMQLFVLFLKSVGVTCLACRKKQNMPRILLRYLPEKWVLRHSWKMEKLKGMHKDQRNLKCNFSTMKGLIKTILETESVSQDSGMDTFLNNILDNNQEIDQIFSQNRPMKLLWEKQKKVASWGEKKGTPVAPSNDKVCISPTCQIPISIYHAQRYWVLIRAPLKNT